MTNAITQTSVVTGNPILGVSGDDANIGIEVTLKGTGQFLLNSPIVVGANQGNSITLQGATTGNYAMATTIGPLLLNVAGLKINDSGTITQYVNTSSNGIHRFDGVIQARNGLSLNAGTANSPIFTAPLLACNASNPTSLVAGSSGQSLVSRGANNTPYWGYPAVPITSVYGVYPDVGTNATKIATSALSVINNTLGLSFNQNVISGFNIGSTYKVSISFQMQQLNGAQAPQSYNGYFSLNSEDIVTTSPALNAGVGTGGNHSASLPNTDYASFASSGFFQPTSAKPNLYAWIYLGVASNIKISFDIERIV